MYKIENDDAELSSLSMRYRKKLKIQLDALRYTLHMRGEIGIAILRNLLFETDADKFHEASDKIEAHIEAVNATINDIEAVNVEISQIICKNEPGGN